MDSEDHRNTSGGFDWRNLTLYLAAIAAIILCALMLRPFLPAITGAIVLAILTQRPYQWIASRQKSPTLSATIGVILVALCIIGPAIFLAQSIGHHVLVAIHGIRDGSAAQGFREFLDRSPRAASVFQYFSDNVSLGNAIEKLAGLVTTKLASALRETVALAMQVVITLFLLFFLYRDKEVGLAALRSILPLDKTEQHGLVSRVADTIWATVLGRFLVAGIQGIVAGVAFLSLGVSGASLLGIITAITAMVPSFGAFLVWVPVAIYLFVIHEWIRGIIMVAVGSLIISTLDNFLYPILVGTRLRLHTVRIFLSILGGIWFFGISGLVLGPVVFAITESILLIWRRRTNTEAESSGRIVSEGAST